MAMGAGEITITILARNEASTALRSVARDVASLGASAVAIARLGQSFGLLDKNVADAITTVGSFISLAGTLTRGLAALNRITSIATAVQWAHNASLAMKISLLTLGVGLIAATAAYMGWLAATTREAASAQAQFNEQAAQMPERTRSIQRAGEEYYRRGVEG